MKIIELEIMVTFFATVFALLAGVNFLAGSDSWFLGLFGASIVCLIAGKWLDIVDRVHLENEVEELEKVIKCKGAL